MKNSSIFFNFLKLLCFVRLRNEFVGVKNDEFEKKKSERKIFRKKVKEKFIKICDIDKKIN